MLRVVVLVSGQGSNLQALLDAAGPDSGYRVAGVISNVPGVGALDRAIAARVETMVIDHRDFASRDEFDARIGVALHHLGAELVCLAGFMRILGPELVRAWAGRMLNIHPSLLPAFRGLDTHRRALEAGVKVHGCTVHEVVPELDAGQILVQGLVPVGPDDDAAMLAARVLTMEHQCYPHALRLHPANKKSAGKACQRLLLHPSFTTD